MLSYFAFVSKVSRLFSREFPLVFQELFGGGAKYLLDVWTRPGWKIWSLYFPELRFYFLFLPDIWRPGRQDVPESTGSRILGWKFRLRNTESPHQSLPATVFLSPGFSGIQ